MKIGCRPREKVGNFTERVRSLGGTGLQKDAMYFMAVFCMFRVSVKQAIATTGFLPGQSMISDA
mgnify:FL=1